MQVWPALLCLAVHPHASQSLITQTHTCQPCIRTHAILPCMLQANGGKKPAWYHKLVPFQSPRPSSTRISTSTGTGPTDTGTSVTLDSNQSSLQLTGSKATILSSTLRTHVPKSANRKYFPSLPAKASIPFDGELDGILGNR